jgi:hypothetical protein
MKKVRVKIAESIAALVNVKSCVTFALVGTLCALAFKSGLRISEELFAAVVTAVITYFFTRKNEAP